MLFAKCFLRCFCEETSHRELPGKNHGGALYDALQSFSRSATAATALCVFLSPDRKSADGNSTQAFYSLLETKSTYFCKLLYECKDISFLLNMQIKNETTEAVSFLYA